MADNVGYTAGAGTTIAADEVVDGVLGTVKVQYVKLMDGVLDGTTKATVGANGLKTDPTSAVATNTGVRSASTQRVTIATDDVVPAAQSGTWNVTNVSGTVSLPTGASTAAKQPALGTAGTASADVISVQGIASMTALKVDGTAAIALNTGTRSATTQRVTVATDDVVPVSGTFWQATQPISGSLTTVSTITNLSQMGGVAIALNTGTRSTGTQRVTIATDDVVPASQSGTWTVQPGNTANTTAWKVDGTAAIALNTGTRSATTQRVTIATDDVVPAIGFGTTCATDITRPADTIAYTANDTWSDSTSAPTAGGYTLTSAGRISGGSGVITDIFFLSSAVPATLLQAEMHIFDSAATAVNDNAAWNLSDADSKLCVAIVPFTLVADANNSKYHAQNLNIGFTCVGSANLRYLIKVKNAYTPISAEVLTVRAKVIYTN